MTTRSLFATAALALCCAGCGSGGGTVTVTPSADAVAQKQVIQLSVETKPVATGDVKLDATAGQFETTSQHSATIALSAGNASVNWSCDASKDSHCAGHVGFTATVNNSSGFALVTVALPATPDGGNADAGSNGP